jgi:hypothetical protein
MCLGVGISTCQGMIVFCGALVGYDRLGFHASSFYCCLQQLIFFLRVAGLQFGLGKPNFLLLGLQCIAIKSRRTDLA